jgi:hypothetical protein
MDHVIIYKIHGSCIYFQPFIVDEYGTLYILTNYKEKS